VYAAPCGVPTPQESTQTFIKRVVGMPGDKISIVGGHVIRNGRPGEGLLHQPVAAPQSTCTFAKPITVRPAITS